MALDRPNCQLQTGPDFRGTLKSDAEFLARIDELIGKWKPLFLVVEGNVPTRRRIRARRRMSLVLTYAETSNIQVCRPTKSDVRSALQLPLGRKQEIAEHLVDFYPELGPVLPNRRRLWDSEDIRINIFDALSLGVTALLGIDHDERHGSAFGVVEPKHKPATSIDW